MVVIRIALSCLEETKVGMVSMTEERVTKARLVTAAADLVDLIRLREVSKMDWIMGIVRAARRRL